jgi:hypothetical protein
MELKIRTRNVMKKVERAIFMATGGKKVSRTMLENGGFLLHSDAVSQQIADACVQALLDGKKISEIMPETIQRYVMDEKGGVIKIGEDTWKEE